MNATPLPTFDRTLRVMDAAALPLLLGSILYPFLGGNSLTVYTAGGLLLVWLVRRLQRATDWYAPYRVRFISIVLFALDVSLAAAFVHNVFA